MRGTNDERQTTNDRTPTIRDRRQSSVVSRGFTLVELLVAIGVFSIAMLIGVGALLTTVGANHKAQAIQSVMNNLNHAVESVARNIPVGTNYHCGGGGILSAPQDCVQGDTVIALLSHDGRAIVYEFLNQRLLRSIDGGPAVAITAPEVVIEEGMFYVRGSAPGDDEQPQVLIKIRGYAGINEKSRSDFALQTTVTQRALDI